MAQVKDVQGEIKRVTDITEKEYTVKQGKNAGNTFKSYSIGICMDDGNWYNIKDTNKERAQEILINQKTNENFKPGDTVKIFIESEDPEGKWWKIISITDMAKEEDMTDLINDPAPAPQKAFDGVKMEPTPKPVAPAPPPAKDMQAVQAFLDKDKDKYLFGMACNNAATIFASILLASKIESTSKEATDCFEEVKEFMVARGNYYDELVREHYTPRRKY